MIVIFDETLEHPFLDGDKYKQLAVAYTDRWIIFVHPDQSFAGRMYVAHHEFNDPEMMRTDDYFELYHLCFPWIRKIVRSLIGNPVRFNTAEFGNDWRHLHYHLIPRHNTDVVVGNVFVGRESERDLRGNYAHSSRYRRLQKIQVAEMLAREIRKGK